MPRKFSNLNSLRDYHLPGTVAVAQVVVLLALLIQVSLLLSVVVVL
jgi:hypothetical protein